MEVDAAVAQEVDIAIGGLDILLVDAIHDKHRVTSELQARSLHQSECIELQTYDIVTLHAQVSRYRQLLLTHLNGELQLRSEVSGMLLSLSNDLADKLSRVGGNGFIFDDILARVTGGESQCCSNHCCLNAGLYSHFLKYFLRLVFFLSNLLSGSSESACSQ